MTRCKNCLINEKFPNIKLDEHNTCNLCSAKKDHVTTNNRFDIKKTQKEFEEYISKIKGKNEYDCVHLISGGKDSAYLLHLLKEKYKLNVLTVYVDTGLIPDISHYNVKKTVEIFGTDHITVKPEDDLFKRIYRQVILNPTEKNYTMSVCAVCHLLIRSIGVNIAAKKDIPLIVGGYTQNQFKFKRPELDEETMSSCWVPENISNAEDFDDKDLSYFWNPKMYKIKPRFMHPLCFIDKPKPNDMIEILGKKGLNKKRNLSPLYTNCHMMWLTAFLDVYTDGYSFYEKHLCNMIRNGKESRLKWSILLPAGNWLLKNKLIKRKQIKKSLKYIDLSMKDIKN